MTTTRSGDSSNPSRDEALTGAEAAESGAAGPDRNDGSTARSGPEISSSVITKSGRPSGEAVIECRGLTKRFRDFWMRPRVTAVENLDLELRRGEVLGLLGPNGSGKSTTIKLLLGLLFPTSGEIQMFGKPPTDPTSRQRVGYVPEDSHLYPFLDTKETLQFFGRLFGIDAATRKARIDELVEMVGLHKVGSRRVGEFSKGMQRRLGLAQALINDPEVLVLDEPTSGLDPIGTREVKDRVIDLAREGRSILITTHLLADVEDICDRVVIMYGGKSLLEGPVQELIRNEQTSIIRTERLTDSQREGLVRAAQELGIDRFEPTEDQERLERVFVRAVREASQTAETSGAQLGGALAPFLRGREADGSSSGATDAGKTDAGEMGAGE